jgi:hypothetical protein
VLHLYRLPINLYLPDPLICHPHLILHPINLNPLLLNRLLQVLQPLFIVVIVVKFLVHLRLELSDLSFEALSLKHFQL